MVRLEPSTDGSHTGAISPARLVEAMVLGQCASWAWGSNSASDGEASTVNRNRDSGRVLLGPAAHMVAHELVREITELVILTWSDQ